MTLTDSQRLLLGELAPWKILALADIPDYWCRYIRDRQGGGSVRSDRDVWPADMWRKTYPWGIAITAAGDYLSTRKRTDPAHAATITWAQITRWVEALPAEWRADARRNRNASRDTIRAVADRLIGGHTTTVPAVTDQLDLFAEGDA